MIEYIVGYLSWVALGIGALWVNPESRTGMQFVHKELRRGWWQEADFEGRVLMCGLFVVLFVCVHGGPLAMLAATLTWLLDAAGRLVTRSACRDHPCKHA